MLVPVVRRDRPLETCADGVTDTGGTFTGFPRALGCAVRLRVGQQVGLALACCGVVGAAKRRRSQRQDRLEMVRVNGNRPQLPGAFAGPAIVSLELLEAAAQTAHFVAKGSEVEQAGEDTIDQAARG